MAVDPNVLADVKTILRDSLRLGDDIAIDEEMALVGGTIDIDSIDILLVISNIEKHFGIKIPNEAVGRAAFATVGTLAKYVDDNKELLKAPPPGAGETSPMEALGRLPHGPEFRFVTAVRELNAGKAAVGQWAVGGEELFLKGHFPGRPVVPGVLIAEALAQVAGIAMSAPVGTNVLLGAVNVKFVSAVVPPASIELRAERVGESGAFEVVASVGGRTVAQGTVEMVLGSMASRETAAGEKAAGDTAAGETAS